MEPLLLAGLPGGCPESEKCRILSCTDETWKTPGVGDGVLSLGVFLLLSWISLLLENARVHILLSSIWLTVSAL